MSEAELKTLKRLLTAFVAGVGILAWGSEHNRAERLQRELDEEKAKNSPWTERVTNREDIQIGE